MPPQPRPATGVDVGGTKLEAAVLRGDEVVARQRTDTPAGDYHATLEAIARLVAEVERAAGAGSDVVGIATPGSLSPATGLIRNANSVMLNGQPFDRDLSARLDRPVRLQNDANCFALAEARSGAGRGAGVVFGVILGTGVGGGIAIDGRVRTGRNAIAGEWGHAPLPDPGPEEIPGPACYCGRTGCIEVWCSGPGLAADHRRESGVEMTADMIAAVAEAGDGEARATLTRHIGRLGRALAVVVNVLDPDAIVLGGGLSNMPHLAGELRTATTRHVFSDCFDTPILQNRLGDSAGVIGAAWLGVEEMS